MLILSYVHRSKNNTNIENKRVIDFSLTTIQRLAEWVLTLSLSVISSQHAAKNSKGHTLTIDGWALTIYLRAMCAVATVCVKMSDSWLRGFQTCLEVHLQQGGSQLPPASPSQLCFPWGSGMDCFNRFTASSDPRCYCCDCGLSQGSHSLCDPVMITDWFSRGGKNPTYGLNLPIMRSRKAVI